MKKVLNIIGGIICVFVCIVLFAIQISFMVINPVKNLITRDSLKELIGNVNVREIISESPKNTSDIYGMFDSLGFNVEETNKILESDSFKEFISDYLYGNINNILDNKNINFEIDDIRNLINNIELEKNINFEKKEEFLKLIEEKYPEIKKNINFSDNINQDIDRNTLEAIKFLTSGLLNVAFIIIFIILYLLLCIFRYSLYKPLIWYGITTVLSSFIMFQVFLSLSLLNISKYEQVEKLESILKSGIKVFRNKGIIISGIMFVVGIFMIVAFYFINKKAKSNDTDNIDTKLESL